MLFVIRCFLCILSLLLIIVPISKADEKVIHAVKIDKSLSPKIDGKLDDECWKKAGVTQGFIQVRPTYGEKPKEDTKVYIVYDEKKLYVGVECFKDDPNKVFASQTKRDSGFFHDDYVEVFLDTYHDHRNCYGFAVNCIGTQSDRRVANEGSIGGGGGPMDDPSKAWDCAWEAKTSKNSNSWIAEMAICFSELRFNKNCDGVWGINFWRGNMQFDEQDTWADVGDRQLAVSKFGHLDGLSLKDIDTSKKVEFKPYATIKPKIAPEYETKPDIGVDIRYPSSTITADFTINPDFGQIEADPERINLKDVEERLTEKRPFFQEGMELFQMPMELFYTRRVGINDLMFGAKAVGKLGGFNFALVDCQSNDVKEGDDTTKDETDNNYLVFRTQTDIGSNASVGVMAINKQKEEGYNRVGGVDFNIPLPLDGRFIAQYTKSWFPNKDDDAFIFSLKRRTRSLSFEIGGGDIGRNFEVESGYIPRTDRRGGNASIGYEYRRDAKIFKMVEGEASYERLENHDGIKTNESRRIELRADIYHFFMSVGPEWYQRTDDFDPNIIYTDRTVFFFTGFFPPKWVSIMCPTMIGKQEGKKTLFNGLGINIKPFQQLRLEAGMDRLDRKGDPLMLNRRFGVSYQFNQQMSIGSKIELTREGKRYIFAIYSWEFQPESNLFLVYTDDKEVGMKTERIFFFKVAYLLKFGLF